MRILISGASISGPVLAYWLTRHGFDVTVVERAAQRRKTGGHAVDLIPAVHGNLGENGRPSHVSSRGPLGPPS